MNSIANIGLILVLAAQPPADASHPEDVLFHCDFESNTWFEEWGERVAPRRVELVGSDPDLRFEPLSGKALRVRIDKDGHYGLSLAYRFQKQLGYEPEEIYFRYALRRSCENNEGYRQKRGGRSWCFRQKRGPRRRLCSRNPRSCSSQSPHVLFNRVPASTLAIECQISCVSSPKQNRASEPPFAVRRHSRRSNSNRRRKKRSAAP